MSDYFLVGNLDKRQFVELNNFTPAGYEADEGEKLLDVSSQRIATVVIYLQVTSDSFPLMGAWAGDRVIVARDEDRRTTIYEEMRKLWEDITEDVAAGFFKTVEESSEPFVLPRSVVKCPSCGESTARSQYSGGVHVITINCGACGGWETIEAAGAQWSA